MAEDSVAVDPFDEGVVDDALGCDLDTESVDAVLVM